MAEDPLGLSPRERQIADLLLQGCDNAEMAKLLRMKRRTVKAYMNRLFRRFEIKDGIKRVKLATLLYRRLHSRATSGASRLPGMARSEPSNSSLNAGPPSAALAIAPETWQTPAAELPATGDADSKLNLSLTA